MKIVKVIGASVALAALTATAAVAVEVRQAAEVKASPSAVWDKIGGWCAIKDWHPAIANCDESKRGFRILTLKDGGKIVEKITKKTKNSYSYEIVESPLPVKNYHATLTAKPDSLGTTDVVWTAKFDAKGKPDSEAEAVIKGVFEGGLKNIKDNVKFDAKPAAATAPANAAPVAVAAAAARDEAKLKAREERHKKWEAAKAAAQEKAAKAKLAALEKYAKLKAAVAEKAQKAAEAAKAAYEKAKAAATTAVAPKPAEPKKP